MTVRNLTLVSRRDNRPWHEDSLRLTCEMLDHETGEWYRQDIDCMESEALKRLSHWNAIYDTPEVKASSAAMVQDIYDNQAAYGCGF